MSAKSQTSIKGKPVSPAQIQEIFNQLGVVPTAADYKPVFLDTVQVLGPTGAQSVSPMYCLSIPSALSLAYLLLDQQPTLYLADPSPFSPGSHFSFSQQVPWGNFAINGAVRNMGLLAFYFLGNNGPQGGPIALRNCIIDIQFG